jgi:hypothetical protein
VLREMGANGCFEVGTLAWALRSIHRSLERAFCVGWLAQRLTAQDSLSLHRRGGNL